MSADQELAATGGASVVGLAVAAVAAIAAGVVMIWRKIATRAAQ